ncbi:MAG TPA: hypothetical protein PK082_04340, partial [Phycisphaerae bacterium]|nr:hypothetical protein [Phycisphaerae bacterium]
EGKPYNVASSAKVLFQFLTGQVDVTGDGSIDYDARNLPPAKASLKYVNELTTEALPKENATEFLDSWRKGLAYEKTGGFGGRPVIISAGPDGKYPSPDDKDNVRSDGR